MNNVLILFGSFVSLLLIVNAYFTRKTLEKISSVELRLVKYSTKHDATDERSKDTKLELDKLRDRVYRLESGQSQLLHTLDQNDKL
tara:strand:+ start:761 stop:1018 length:258 start_codon:yes stop_codon:yes gene_type:complete